jgi:hypothetical protein
LPAFDKLLYEAIKTLDFVGRYVQLLGNQPRLHGPVAGLPHEGEQRLFDFLNFDWVFCHSFLVFGHVLVAAAARVAPRRIGERDV